MAMGPEEILALPGGDLVERGLEDLRRERESIDALLVSIGAPRLRRLGIGVNAPFASPEHRLYRLLGKEKGFGAHSAYNGLVRRLVSFERTLPGARGGPLRAGPASSADLCAEFLV